MDITSTHLEAAIIDQKVAGLFSGKVYAFVAALNDDGDWILGVAVANERGYTPIIGKTFTVERVAREWADGLNHHIGLNEDQVSRIIISTMGGRTFDTRKPCARCGLLSGHRYPCTGE